LISIPGASHLFEEKGTLEKVIDIAGMWFGQQLQKGKKMMTSKNG
jgi:hypothetical protein